MIVGAACFNIYRLPPYTVIRLMIAAVAYSVSPIFIYSLIVVIWRHIIAMAMDSLDVVESLQIFEYQSICLIIIADIEAIQPFALNH